MELDGKVIVVTGGANGIGRALCRRFAEERAACVVVADIDERGAEKVASEFDGLAIPTNVANEDDVRTLVSQTLERFGRIDLFCSNAGIAIGGGLDVPNEDWSRIWEINFMAHLYAARAVMPAMIEQGYGYFLHTSSAAGLLSHIHAAPYAVTKHAVVAFAEWLSINYADAGIKVSCLCPQGVQTRMLEGSDPTTLFLRETVLSPETVADAAVQGLRSEKFLILPHPEVAKFFQRKASDYDKWLSGMRRLKHEMDPCEPVVRQPTPDM